MKCENEVACDGVVDESTRVSLQVSCVACNVAFACSKCGRLHWPNGVPVYNRQNHRAFLEEGTIVNRDAGGVEQSRL